MKLHDAFDQISTIRTHLAATDRLRGLRALPIALSGVLALLAALGQAVWIADPLQSPGRYLGLWTSAAVISALAAGLELVRRVRGSGSQLSVANAVVAARQFAPCLGVGAVVTLFVATRLPDELWLLPGLWQLLIGLGHMAAHQLLPAPAFAIGPFYLLSGTSSLWLGPAALQPWVMGLPFAVGQGTLAVVLWWNQERQPQAFGAEARR